MGFYAALFAWICQKQPSIRSDFRFHPFYLAINLINFIHILCLSMVITGIIIAMTGKCVVFFLKLFLDLGQIQG